MAEFHPSVSNFLNAASSQLGELISQEISWRPGSAEGHDANFEWWSCALTVDEACRFYAGASKDLWDQLQHDSDSGFAVLAAAIERAAAERFGSQVRCNDIASCEAPPEDGATSVWELSAGGIEVVLSSQAVEALGGGPPEEAPAPWPLAAGNGTGNSMGMLMHVEIPVSVSLGRTKLRMKELLGLGHGSVVELDQELGDQVEIRVNNCVIAHGEVVAVDGNYGVRILSMAANEQGRRGLLAGDAV